MKELYSLAIDGARTLMKSGAVVIVLLGCIGALWVIGVGLLDQANVKIVRLEGQVEILTEQMLECARLRGRVEAMETLKNK